MSTKTDPTVDFQGIPQLEGEHFGELLLDAAREYSDLDRDSFLGDLHMLVGSLVDDVPKGELLTWYARDPNRLGLADEWAREYQPTNMGNKGFAHDIIWGGLYVAVYDVLMSRLNVLEEQKLMPWQRPSCTYCGERPEEVKPDRIKQHTCKRCWDEGVDGPWPE